MRVIVVTGRTFGSIALSANIPIGGINHGIHKNSIYFDHIFIYHFYFKVAEHSAVNQMTASNLAVCLAPTLLRLHHAPPHTGSTKEGNSNRLEM